jgi:hypothetical protein
MTEGQGHRSSNQEHQMREPKDYTQTSPDLRTFSLNSDYAYWLTLEDQEESMLPRVGRPECLSGRVERLPPGVEGEDGSELGIGEKHGRREQAQSRERRCR